jgi:uncharacterized OB-fold protein
MTVSTNRATVVDYPRASTGNRQSAPRSTRPRTGWQDRRTMAPSRALPRPTPETQHFWDGTADGELRLQRCGACDSMYFPPQPICPRCANDDVEVVRASGRGTLYSYVITHRAAPGFEAPYVIAEVELEEGPRLLTNLVGLEPDPEQLPLDLPLEVTFETFGDVTLPLFQPRST